MAPQWSPLCRAPSWWRGRKDWTGPRTTVAPGSVSATRRIGPSRVHRAMPAGRWGRTGALPALHSSRLCARASDSGQLHEQAFPPIHDPINDALAPLATSYRIVIGVAGAWLTARLAPTKPLKHALILGYLGAVLGLVGVVATWNKGLGPHWYPIALVVLAVPRSWVGGKRYEARAQRRTLSAAR